MSRLDTDISQPDAILYALYFDPAEVDPMLDEPAYLHGVFSTRADAEAGLRAATRSPDDARWLVIEEPIDEMGWTTGFVTE